MKRPDSPLMMQVAASVLPNGVRVLSAHLPHVESVAIGLWVDAGSRHEPAALSGTSHFIEHLLFKGTRRRGPRDISEAIEGRGGYLDAFTQEEATCVYARVAREHAGAALDVMADMALHPRMDPDDLDKERNVIVEEILMYRDQPEHVAHESLMESLWTRHGLGRPVTGSLETLRRLTRADILRYKRARYVPAGLVVAFAGAMPHAQCAALARRLLGRMPRGRRPPRGASAAGAGQSAAVWQTRNVEQAHFALGFRHFGRRDPRRYALRVLNAVLGENMSSRLFQVLRERFGLAYSVHSSVQLFDETGALLIGAGLDAGRIERTAGLVIRELRRLKDRPVSAPELRRAKDYAIGQMKLGLESTTNQMMWIGEQALLLGEFIPPETLIQEIERVSADGLRALARAILCGSRASVSVVAPDAAAKQMDAVRALIREL